ncbi:hypothetical protein ZIOFF_061422 [Zingiber officinale]|uniref:Uncharacterized protein n=1 Tax=Zingiber officinale TaxID=94328 RepID=A0A8J5F014_ZINOF|nr:hypothetical protein ZIOFF_061422 [Zingiber officinale]
MCCSCQISWSGSSQSRPADPSPALASEQRKSSSTNGNHPESFSSSTPHSDHHRSPRSASPSTHPASISAGTCSDGTEGERRGAGSADSDEVLLPPPALAEFSLEEADLARPAAADAVFCRRGALPEGFEIGFALASPLHRFIAGLLFACILGQDRRSVKAKRRRAIEKGIAG